MPQQTSPSDLIASALRLPVESRLAVMDALHASLADNGLDHGSQDAPFDVDSAWQREIERRHNELTNGRIETIPSEQAEALIRGDALREV